MGFIRSLLPAKVHRGVAGIVRRPCFPSFGRKPFALAHASSSVPSTVKCSSEVRPFACACATTRADKPAKQQVVIHLFHQQTLAADRVQHLPSGDYLKGKYSKRTETVMRLLREGQ